MADPAPAQLVGHVTANESANVVGHGRRVVLDVLQTFFSNQTMLGQPNPYLWLKDDPKSRIVIAAEYPEDITVRNPNHMILVNRGPITFPKLHLDNVNQRLAQYSYQAPPQTPDGARRIGHKFSTVASYELQVQCFSRLPSQAEEIALVVAMVLLTFQTIIRSRGRFHRLENPTIGNETPIESSDAQIMRSVVPVSFMAYTSASWELIVDPVTYEIIPKLILLDC